jgi:TonB family protein
MASGAQTRVWDRPSRRRAQRFQLKAPLEVTALRSGIPDTMPGRSLNLCEGGVAAMVAGELVPGETVGVELRLSYAMAPLRTRAMVRYHDKLRCGLEFAALPAEQRAAIREWAREAKAETEMVQHSKPEMIPVLAKEDVGDEKEDAASSRRKDSRKPRRKWRTAGGLVVFLLVLAAVGLFWWKWNRDWEELEAGLRTTQHVTEKTPVQVPAEVMQKLIVHRVEPEYPAAARKENVEGIIALDVVVASDGSVLSMKALNGPDVLAGAAMDALRWWKFEPYRINGEATAVETTVAVEFKK